MTERLLLQAPRGYRSPTAGLFVAQMDDQNRRLTEDLSGATGAELAWQPRPGMNTIGMLLAHNAVVEVWWIHVAMHGPEGFDARPVLGIDGDDDGMPCPPRGLPPQALAGKKLAFYDNLMERARAHTVREARRMTDADLDRRIRRIRKRDQQRQILNVRWILYHILEHEAGHYGQINLLRHQYRDRRKKSR